MRDLLGWHWTTYCPRVIRRPGLLSLNEGAVPTLALWWPGNASRMTGFYVAPFRGLSLSWFWGHLPRLRLGRRS